MIFFFRDFSWTPGYTLPRYKHTFFALISSELVLHLILFLLILLFMLLISSLFIVQIHILILDGLFLWFLIISLYIYLWLFCDFPSSSHLLDFLNCRGLPSYTNKILCLPNNPKNQQF